MSKAAPHGNVFSRHVCTCTLEGLGDSYDIRFKSREGDEWQEYFDYAADSIIMTGFPEGVLDMYIRTNCGDLHTVWVHYSQFFYYKNNRCIDFLDINDVNCWFGSNLYRGGVPSNAFMSNRKMDYGFESIKSRHTIHYNKHELDPRTENRLTTVSPHEIASVRLGNWHNEGEAEGLIYKLDIAEDAEEILLVHYAVVMEDPDHPIENQPKFGLRIVRDDEDETPLDTFGCAQADFVAGWGSEGWNTIYPPPTEAIPKPVSILWRKWNTIGISLRDYGGEKLKIKLYTMDCAGGAHYAYAYFALSCASAVLEGLSCGDSKTADFLAPEGFNYRWYKKSNPDIDNPLGTGRAFSINAQDTAVYACDVIQVLNENCYYTLYATSTPRYPRANGSYEQKVENCQNIVQFSDSSYVIMELEDGDSILNDPYTSILWDFGDETTSTEIHPTHVFPEEGGTYTVKQTVILATCEHIKEYELTLPKLGTIRDTLPISLCLGYTYTDPSTGKNYMRAGDFSDTTVHSNGCDSIHIISIKMVESVDTVFTDTVCSADLPYEYRNKTYNESGEYRDTIRAVQGCDSIYDILKLTVNESLVLSLSDSVIACADDENLIIPYEISSGVVSSFSVLFDHEEARSMDADSLIPIDNSLVIPISPEIIPNNYDFSVTFENMDCGSVSKDIRLHLYYPDTILAQRWNDVIGIRNATYNGGYDFTTYQWFEDGKPLEGQTSPNLYHPLIENGAYTALITREDGVQTFTCPLIARIFTDPKDAPEDITFEETSINVSTKAATMAKVWSVSGILVSATALSETNTLVPLPKYAGVYILEVVNTDGSRTTQKFVGSL